MALDRNGGGVSRRTFVKGSLAASALAALAACGKNNSGASANGGTVKASEGGTFKYYISDPVAIDHYNLQESEGTQVGHVLFDSLVEWDWDKSDVKAKAAESWEINDDNTVFTFHLKDAKFHNGDPVTSESFKRGWQRLVDTTMDTPGEIGYHLAPVVGYDEMAAGEATELTGLTCPDDKTFVVTLKEPMADFLAVCCHPGLAPAPQAALDDPASFLLAPIGNGPFMMDGQWVDGQYINLKPFADYWGEKPLLDGINFQILSSDDTAWLEYQAGNLDFLIVAAGHFNEARQLYGDAEDDGYLANPGHQYIWGDETSIYYLICNNEDEVMSNRDLRIAISYAVDRQAICDTALQGTRSPATNMLAVGVPGSVEGGWMYTSPTKDIEKANEYFDKAGYPANADGKRDLTLTFSTNTGSSNEEIMQMIMADLEACGVSCTLNLQEWAAYIDSLQSMDYQIGRLGWTIQVPYADGVLQPLFYTGSGDNNSGYSNPDFDAALDYARTVVDADERTKAYQDANAIVAEDMPVIPMFNYCHTYLTSGRVNNFYYSPSGYITMTKCWLS